jgi:nucleoside-diphosphate-sugar epimerase
VEWPGLDLVHLGTAAEYGVAGANLAEDCRPRPTGTYGRTKLAGTHCVTRYALAGRLKGMTARLFTVYGPGEHDGRLLPSLLKTADTGARLRLTRGMQARDFTYVADVAEGLLRLGRLASVKETVVNLATGRLTRVRDFAEIAARVLDLDSDLLAFGALPTRGDEMVHGPVTIERLWRLTGWVPLTAVADGIRRTADALGWRPRRRILNDVPTSNVPGRVAVPVCGR